MPRFLPAHQPAHALGMKPQKARHGPWLQIKAAYRMEWNRYDLPIAGLDPRLEGFRILHLTDLHLKPAWYRAYDNLLQEIREKQPDVILFTGDLIDDKRDHRPALPVLHKFIEHLESRLGTFAILGNHDGDLLMPELAEMNCRLMDGQTIVLEEGRGGVELIGLQGPYRIDFDESNHRHIPAKSPHRARVVMSHYPDLIKCTAHLQPDVFLAGHTHGGQICLPGGRPLLTHDSLPKNMAKGLHRVGNTWLNVPRGMGFSGLPFRFFCPAEVVELRLTQETTE